MWNVFYYNKEKNTIEIFDIFAHMDFLQDCLEDYKAFSRAETMSYIEFRDKVQSIAKKHFYNNHIQPELDIYTQISLNWNLFVAELINRLEDYFIMNPKSMAD